MGQKKRNLGPRSKPSSRGVASPISSVVGVGLGIDEAAGEDSQSKLPLAEWGNLDHSAIKLECERALTAFRRGNYTKALRLIKDACHRNAKSALLQRCQGTICAKVAGIMDDQTAKQRHLRNAVESARRACSLSPSSIEFAHFYANLLYEASQEPKDYDEVVLECERALAIENPIDPAKESFQEEQKIPTTEGRIAHVRQELRSLIQRSHICSISTLMKTWNGDEKLHIVHFGRPMEDPMEVRSVQTRRLNEIKKTTKTPEERRKEIEVRIAAARLLQQKSESQGEESKIAEPNSVGSSHKSGERRKHGSSRQKAGTCERKNQVMPYWNSLSYERKKDLLCIRVDDLMAHFQSSKDGLYNEVLSEALSFAEVNRTWCFWECCRCGEKFANGESHMHHLVQEHTDNIVLKLQSVLPQAVDSEWLEMLANCSWKPLDLTASIRMLEHRPNLQDAEFGEKFSIENSNKCQADSYCTKDTWDSSFEKNLVHSYNGNSLESEENGKDLNLDCMACDGNQSSKMCTLPNSWPMSNDTERAKLLEKIGSIFQLLIKHKFLAVGHLQKVIQFTMDELQGLTPGSPLLYCGIDQTPLCICFLRSDQLREVLKFIQEVSHACVVGRCPEKIGPNDIRNLQKLLESEEKVVLTEDNSFLLLDEGLLPNDDVMRSEVLSMNSAAVRTENSVHSASDSLLSWIFAGLSIGEQLEAWSCIREERTQQATEFLQLLEKEFGCLQSIGERKYEHLGYEEALQGLEALCLEERKKGENVTEFIRCSYDSVLRKRRKELMEGKNDVLSRFELDVINSILKEVENVKMSHFVDEETYIGMDSHLYDLEPTDEDRELKDVNQANTCIEIALHRSKEQLAVELSRIDARLMRSVSSVEQLEDKLKSVAALDYRSILLPLLKSFVQAHLEDLAEKDATEKSDAAREALLAEIALDSKKNVGGGSYHSKHTQNKIKDKKRNKDSRKIKETKSCFDKQLATSEPDSCVAASGGEYVDPEMLMSESGDDDFKRMEDDFQRMVELEAEERMLEKTLEYQRRIENEAKQKHVTEQWRRNSQTHSKCVVEAWSNLSSQPCLPADSHCHQGFLELNNGSPNSYEGIQINSVGGSTSFSNFSAATVTHQSKSPWSHQPVKVCEGLLNGEIPFNDDFSMEQQTGRKGKCRSYGGLPDRRHQGVHSGKENINVEISQPDVPHNKQSGNHGSVHSDDAHEKMPLVSNSKTLQKIHQPDLMNPLGEVIAANENNFDVYGAGLQNEVGEYNCFLNVIIQSLWHLRRFREEFLSRQSTEHVHVGDPCVVCALYGILSSLSKASVDAKGEAVAPSSLRVALSNLYPGSNFFQEGQMNDASEVLAVIFECLHQSFTVASSASDDSVESNCMGTWDCASSACIVHCLFGMDVFERMNCYNCGLESRHLKYTCFFHNINASALRTMKAIIPDNSFDKLLNLVEMNHQLACDPEAGGCGKLNHIHHILSTPPHVFTTVLGWQNTREHVDDIMATLEALDTVIDISVLYRGLDPKNIRRLVSVVCYYGQHYHCFAYDQDSEQWIMYDDKTVKVIGTWEDVLSKCRSGHLQPQVLFYEAVN